MLFFGFPSVTEFIDQRRSKFSLNLMHQIMCCAALVSPRIGNVIVEMSRVYMFTIVDFYDREPDARWKEVEADASCSEAEAEAEAKARFSGLEAEVLTRT